MSPQFWPPPPPVRGTVDQQAVPALSAVNVSVTFPAGRFTAPPRVQATAWGAATRDVAVGVTDVTTAGCVISLGSNSPVVRTFGAFWTAE